MESKPASVRLVFTWKQFSPDLRAYKPSTPVIEVDYHIGIDVPLKHEFILNSAEIIQAQLSASDEVYPILTPLGMRYCIDQFEMVMADPTVDTTEAKEADDEDWDEGEVEPPTKTATDDEDWEDAPAETKTKDDKDWDENWE